jgi:hypothetical protein
MKKPSVSRPRPKVVPKVVKNPAAKRMQATPRAGVGPRVGPKVRTCACNGG